MSEIQAFSENPQESLFEKASHQNGGTFWLATDLMGFLGYDDRGSFRRAISKAQIACANLNIPVEENFIAITHDDGTTDTKLTRFACYLVAMNADVRKEEVAQAQAYLVAMAESVRRYREEADRVARVQYRGEITEREKSLSGIAKEAGVENYPFFQNAGYRGMYNMNLSQLRSLREIPANRSPLDFMGKAELAANLFRITQTEERIKTQNSLGQTECEDAAAYVGREVRDVMQRASGRRPEDLAVAEDIKAVKREIKQTHRKLRKLDKPSNLGRDN